MRMTLQIWLRTLILIVKELNKPSMVHIKRYTKITHKETTESERQKDAQKHQQRNCLHVHVVLNEIIF